MSIRLWLPFPPSDLSGNGRKWKFEKARLTRQYKERCVKALNEQRLFHFPALHPPVRADICFVLTTKRRRDYDNLIASLKSGIDTLVECGILVDDNVWKFTPSYRVERGKEQLVRIELISAEEDGDE